MSSIMKNGQQFGGVPTEVITAWQPTGDPVQVAEPLTGNTDISDIGDGTITGAIRAVDAGITKFVKLWDNPSPSASFSAQTISLNLNTYDAILINIEYIASANTGRMNFLAIKGEKTLINFVYTHMFARSVEVNDSGAVFGDCIYKPTYATATSNTGNEYGVPIAIYGVKF